MPTSDEAQQALRRYKNRKYNRDLKTFRERLETDIENLSLRYDLPWIEIVELVRNPFGEGDDGCDEIASSIQAWMERRSRGRH